MLKNGFKLTDVLVPGDRIRSFDFPFDKRLYIEGTITSVDDRMIEVVCDTDTKPGGHMANCVVLVPVVSMMDEMWEFDRIEKLEGNG